MTTGQGELISRYRLIEKIGEGGMGVVWKAVDTSLGREVAVKFLPESVVEDAERISRFEKEARTLASLNHPNIVTIYTVEESGGRRYLAMELVKGEPVSKRIRSRGLDLDKIFEIGIPLASALAAAHEKGTIHRDLKPANIMVDEDGNVKVLDFGLAKLKAAANETAESELRTETISVPGQIVGTIPYMSPEQIQAKPVDSRSDIFALGVILYELATGTRPFQGKSSSELMSSILRDAPSEVTSLRAELPPHFGRIIRRCLEKDPNRRYQSALDVRNELEDLQHEIAALRIFGKSSTSEEIERKPRRWVMPASLAAVSVILLLAAWAFYVLRPKFAPPGPQIRSLAVLPLDNLMGDPSQDYFVEGMHDALITELAKTGLTVISRTSVMSYARASGKRLPEIARELKVDALIEGSVLRVGNSVRITAQLIRGSTDQHIWANSYDRDLANAMAMLSEVTRAIAAQIKITLTPEQQARLSNAPAVNPEAQEAYLRGRYYMNRFSSGTAGRSIEFFRKAIDISPDYARAYAGLAMAYGLNAIFNPGSWSAESRNRFRDAALKAVELDPDLAEGHAVLGMVRLYGEWDWAEAERELKLAIELNPADAFIYHPYSDCLLVQGRVEESLAWVKKGADLDPHSPLVVIPVMGHLSFLRRWDEVITQAREFLELFPGHTTGNSILRTALWQKGMYEDALASYRIAWKDDPELLKAFEQGFAKAGPNGALRAAGDLLAFRSQSTYINPLAIAEYYARAGQSDLAFPWLERAFQEHIPFLAHLKADPSYDPIRTDPRFENLLRRMNLSK